MMRKISFIAHSLRLESFDAATLAREANAPLASVNTFLARCPENWFAKAKRATHARGGQPFSYSVTETGRLAMRSLLSELPDFEWSRPPEGAASMEPPGLAIAEASIRKLGEAKPDDRAWLVRHARRNLDWAAAELRNFVPPETNGERSRKLQALREALSTYVQDAYAQRPDRPIPSASSPRPAKVLVPSSTNRLPNVAIAALGARGQAFAMADYAKGVLDWYYSLVRRDGSVRGRAPNVELIKEDTFSGLSANKADWWKANTELFVCIDSDQGVRQLTSALERIRTADRNGVVVILDHGNSHEVARVARANKFGYKARAHQNLVQCTVPVPSALLRSSVKVRE